jgi:phage terminase small subunit
VAVIPSHTTQITAFWQISPRIYSKTALGSGAVFVYPNLSKERCYLVSEKLNMRQRKFAELYVQSGNASESARLAGYSAKYINSNVQKLLQNTAITEYIKELTDKAKDERILTAKDRQVLLSDIAKNPEEETSDRIKAVDTLNKMTGEYLNKVEVNGSLQAETSKLDDLIRQMTDDG